MAINGADDDSSRHESTSPGPGDPMSATIRKFGTDVKDRDGAVGQFTHVVFDPTGHIAGHVVAGPDDLSVTARLVPIEAVSSDSPPHPLLTCSRSEFLAFADAIEDATRRYSLVGDLPMTMLTRIQAAGIGLGGPAAESSDRLPRDTADLGRAQAVMALDGRIGQMSGSRSVPRCERWLCGRPSQLPPPSVRVGHVDLELFRGDAVVTERMDSRDPKCQREHEDEHNQGDEDFSDGFRQMPGTADARAVRDNESVTVRADGTRA